MPELELKYCPRCGETKPKTEFAGRRKLSGWCKPCDSARAKEPVRDMERSIAAFKRTGLDVADDNQVDAWWLRALGHDLTGQPLLDLPQTHRRALTKLALPPGVAVSAL